jgi:hypothetical protein
VSERSQGNWEEREKGDKSNIEGKGKATKGRDEMRGTGEQNNRE